MSVFTVHEPPMRPSEASPDPAQFVFVRDGFSFWAFVFAPLWMLWHRMWLVLLGYVAAAVGLEALVSGFGAAAPVVGLVGVLIALLIGLEAGTLRRFALSRRHWKTVGIVSGDDQEDAERRFFDAWVRKGAGTAAPAAAPPPAPRMLATPPPPSGVIGLFPEPGA